MKTDREQVETIKFNIMFILLNCFNSFSISFHLILSILLAIPDPTYLKPVHVVTGTGRGSPGIPRGLPLPILKYTYNIINVGRLPFFYSQQLVTCDLATIYSSVFVTQLTQVPFQTTYFQSVVVLFPSQYHIYHIPQHRTPSLL